MKKQHELLMKELSERVPSELYQSKMQPQGSSVAAPGEGGQTLPIQQNTNHGPVCKHQRVLWGNPGMPLAMPVPLPYSICNHRVLDILWCRERQLVYNCQRKQDQQGGKVEDDVDLV
jgi:hypothetical protein